MRRGSSTDLAAGLRGTGFFWVRLAGMTQETSNLLGNVDLARANVRRQAMRGGPDAAR